MATQDSFFGEGESSSPGVSPRRQDQLYRSIVRPREEMLVRNAHCFPHYLTLSLRAAPG